MCCWRLCRLCAASGCCSTCTVSNRTYSGTHAPPTAPAHSPPKPSTHPTHLPMVVQVHASQQRHHALLLHIQPSVLQRHCRRETDNSGAISGCRERRALVHITARCCSRILVSQAGAPVRSCMLISPSQSASIKWKICRTAAATGHLNNISRGNFSLLQSPTASSNPTSTPRNQPHLAQPANLLVAEVMRRHRQQQALCTVLAGEALQAADDVCGTQAGRQGKQHVPVGDGSTGREVRPHSALPAACLPRTSVCQLPAASCQLPAASCQLPAACLCPPALSGTSAALSVSQGCVSASATLMRRSGSFSSSRPTKSLAAAEIWCQGW